MKLHLNWRVVRTHAVAWIGLTNRTDGRQVLIAPIFVIYQTVGAIRQFVDCHQFIIGEFDKIRYRIAVHYHHDHP